MDYTLRVPRNLYNVLNLRKGEGKIVSLLLVFSFFQFFSVALFFIAASAIFLTEHPITSLPYVYIATGMAMVVLGYLSSHLEKYISPQQVILGETIMVFLVTLAFRFGFLSEQISWLGYGLIIWHRIMSDYVGDGFNRLALLLFDVRQSKRLFGLISSSEIPANIFGYLMASSLVPIIGTANLLWVSSAGLLISLVFLFFIVSIAKDYIIHNTDEEEDEERPNSSKEKDLVSKFFQSRFILMLSVSVLFSAGAFTFIEFAFLRHVDAAYSEQQDIVKFIAIVFGAGQLVALFIKTFFYGFIQRRFGIKVSLFVLPFVLGIICLATMLESFFSTTTFLLVGTWVVLMLITETLRSSLYNTTFISLLQPLQRKVRLDGYSFLGNVEGFGIGITGLVLVLFFSVSSVTLLHFSITLFIIVIAWIAVIPALNKQYLLTLEDVLKKRVIESSVMELNNPQTLKIVHEKLNSHHPGEVLYALDVLSKEKKLINPEVFSKLLMHPIPEVRKEVYKRVESLKIGSLQKAVRERIDNEPLPDVKKIAIRTYCALGEAHVVDEISPLLDHDDKEIQTGALVGLICFGGINGIIVAGQRLMEYVNSADPDLRTFAAHVIGEVGIRNFYHPLLTLLKDENVDVVKEALRASGRIKHPKLFDFLFKAVCSAYVFEVAVNALIKTGPEVIDHMENEINSVDNPTYLRRLVYVCGRIGGAKSLKPLKDKLYFHHIEVRNQVLQSCALCGFKPEPSEKENLIKTIHQELSDAAWFLNCIEVLYFTNKLMEKSDFQLMIRALRIELKQLKRRLLYLLSFLYNSREILQVWDILQLKNSDKTANALEIVDVVASKELTAVILPLLEDFPISQQLRILNARYMHKQLSVDQYLHSIITGESPAVIAWTQAVAIFMVNQVRVEALLLDLKNATARPNVLVAETAQWTLKKITADNTEFVFAETDPTQAQLSLLEPHHMNSKLLAIEKVMALKTTGLFRETSEELLVDIALILKEVFFRKDEVIVQKNDVGTCMFVIYSGSVKVHDGEHVLATLKSRDFFGELSLLDAEPRSASVTAMEDSLLLRIDQHAFYEIMADRMEVIHEIMKILCRRLRAQNSEVARLNEQLAQKIA